MKNILFLLAIITICSCSKKQDDRPANLLSTQEMVNVLIDIHLAEAKLNQIRIPKDSANKLFLIMEKQILEKHQLADSVYINSYVYYLDHPKQMEVIYNTVVDSLSLREQLLNLN